MKKLILAFFTLCVATLSTNARPPMYLYDPEKAIEITDFKLPLTLSGTFSENDPFFAMSGDTSDEEYEERYVLFRLTCKGGEKFVVTAEGICPVSYYHSNGDARDGLASPQKYPSSIRTTNKGDVIYFYLYGKVGEPYLLKFDLGIMQSDIDRVGVGEWVTLTPEVAPGFELDELSISWNGKEICYFTEQDGSSTRYKFIQPNGKVDISATYKKIDGTDDDNDDENTGDNPKPTDVNEVNVSAQSVVGEKFHTVLGQPLSEPQTSGVTVVTRTYSDGAVRSSKEVR